MIIFLGVAGAGKSVQCQLLAARGNYQWLSSGVLLRLMITDERRQEMLQGKLLQDDEVIKYWEDALERLGDKPELILDGFPRTVAQAQWLLNQAKAGKLQISHVVHLTADQAIVKGRLLQRGRPDDREDSIIVRFKEYEEVTLPVVQLFKDTGIKVHNINGDQPIEKVTEDIVKAFNGN